MKRIISVIIILLFVVPIFAEEIIDKMESTSGWGTSLNEDAEATLTTIDGVNGKAVNVEYKLNTGSYIIIEKEFKIIDLSGGDLIKFQVKASGNKNTLKIIVKDMTNKEYDYFWDSVSNTSFQWFETDIITEIPDQKIKFLKFEINPYASTDEGGSGSITIGPVGLYQSTSQTASTQMVDDFEDSDDFHNLLSGGNTVNYIHKGGGNGNEILEVTNQSIDYLSLQYDPTNGNSDEVTFIFALTNMGSFLDVSDKEYLKFEIWGASGEEKIGISLQDSTTSGDELLLDNYMTNKMTTTRQWVKIPLSDFTSPVKAQLKSLKILFKHQQLPGIGSSDSTIYIDNMQFYSPAKTSGLKTPIDSMDRPLGRASPWIKAGSTFGTEENKKDCAIDVNIVDTEIGKATKIDYAFNDGVWIGIERYFALNLFSHDAFIFDFKGDGQNNDLEVKFTDDDGTVFKRKFYNFTDTEDKWRKMQIQPGKELVFESSGLNNNLKLTSIEKIAFAVTKNDGSEGNIAIDNIKMGDYSPEINTKGKKIIVDLKISPNPFSPDKDGFEDEINFIYTLKKEAKITVLIYDLKGNLIQKLETGNAMPSAVEQKITWTGKDYANKITKNGIFFIKFYAKATDGEEEDIKSIISVLK